jgi:hypothetical protein
MWKFLAAAVAFAAVTQPAHSASAVNLDSEPRTLVVTEGSGQDELTLAAGETAEFCSEGCFVRMPNGDLQPLTGSETIEISGGEAHIR